MDGPLEAAPRCLASACLQPAPHGAPSSLHPARPRPQAVSSVFVGAACVFAATVVRFRFPAFQLPMLLSMLTFVMMVGGTYYRSFSTATGLAWRWMVYAAAAASVATVSGTVVLPVQAGRLARAGLVEALQGLGSAMSDLLHLLAEPGGPAGPAGDECDGPGTRRARRHRGARGGRGRDLP